MVLHVGWHTCTPPSIPPFVHHDVKSLSILFTTFTVKSNNCICIPVDETLQFLQAYKILLDAVLTPKVADFGFVTPMAVNVGSTVIVTAAGAMTLASSRGTWHLSLPRGDMASQVKRTVMELYAVGKHFREQSNISFLFTGHIVNM